MSFLPQDIAQDICSPTQIHLLFRAASFCRMSYPPSSAVCDCFIFAFFPNNPPKATCTKYHTELKKFDHHNTDNTTYVLISKSKHGLKVTILPSCPREDLLEAILSHCCMTSSCLSLRLETYHFNPLSRIFKEVLIL